VERLGRWSATVARNGRVQLHDTHLTPRRSSIPGLTAEARRIAGGVRRRARRWMKR
jgi:hypothetical protein